MLARQPRGWSTWLALTLSGGVATTVLESVLLQRRRTFFTGGFLAVDHVTAPMQAVAFIATSLVLDFAVIGTAAFIVLWVCARAGLARRPAIVLAVALAVGPIALSDFVQYQLLTYLGDAFDLRLMFDLTGQSVGEVLAVSSDHLLALGATAAAAAASIGLLLWLVRTREGRSAPAAAAPSLGKGSAVCAAMLIAAAVLMTAVRSGSDVFDNGLRRKPTGQLLGAVVMAATDVDRDGFGILGRPPDPDLRDSRVRPYALDVPGNGIDENGVGGDLPAATPPYREEMPAAARWRSKPDVVLVVLESFRADAVGARVNGRAVTPVLDALAARGVRVADAYSHNGYTVQSRHHILSGSLAGFDAGSLVEDFKANGYQTAYFSAQDDSFGGAKGLLGFDAAEIAYDARSDRSRRYSTFTTAGSLAVPQAVLLERLQQFLPTRDRERPLFLYVNLHDTHFPYHHGAIDPLVSNTTLAQGDIEPDAAAALREMYLNTAANVDRAVGKVLEDVRAATGREPGVIVLSDHGESLFDEGFLGHGYALNDAQTRIPLIVANLPLTIEEPFGQSDLRGIIRRGLEAGEAMPPTVRRGPAKAVFQYLGAIERPAEIAFVTPDHRVTYDLRERKFKSGAGPWRSHDQLSSSERQQFLDLVHTWERIVVARHETTAAPR